MQTCWSFRPCIIRGCARSGWFGAAQHFGDGVPFAWPRSPDTGPGLTRGGEDLVRACDWLGVMIDAVILTSRVSGTWRSRALRPGG